MKTITARIFYQLKASFLQTISVTRDRSKDAGFVGVKAGVRNKMD
jgi:hypothetical protein